MPALPPDPVDPDDRDPDDRDLDRRSSLPAVSPWIVLGLIAMAGAVIYVVSAVL